MKSDATDNFNLACPTWVVDRKRLVATVHAVIDGATVYGDRVKLDGAKDRSEFARSMAEHLGATSPSVAVIERKLFELYEVIEVQRESEQAPPAAEGGLPYAETEQGIVW